MLRLTLLLFSLSFIVGCGAMSSVVSVGPYTAQNISKLNCAIDIKEFSYQPYENSKIEHLSVDDFAKYGGVNSPNRIMTSDAQEIYLAVPVASYIQIGTALELERSGVRLEGKPTYYMHAKINQLKADVLARTITWNYSITYTLVDARTGNEIFSTTFDELNYKTGKVRSYSAPYGDVINHLIYSGYTKLIADMKSNNVCYSSPVEKKAVKSTSKKKR